MDISVSVYKLGICDSLTVDDGCSGTDECAIVVGSNPVARTLSQLVFGILACGNNRPFIAIITGFRLDPTIPAQYDTDDWELVSVLP